MAEAIPMPPVPETVANPRHIDMMSPTQVGPEGVQIATGDTLAFREYSPTAAEPETFQLPHVTIEGVPSLDIRLGGQDDSPVVKIIDISRNPMMESKDPRYPHMRQAGHDNGEPVGLAGDFLMIIPGRDGLPAESIVLSPGSKEIVGRGDPTENSVVWGSNVLPETVSRDHMAVGIAEDGKLFIENHSSTNQTRVEQPEGVQTAETAVLPEQTVLDNAAEKVFDDNAETLSARTETALKTGLAGEVIASATVDRGRYAKHALVLRQQTDEGFLYSVAEAEDDGSFRVRAITAGEAVSVDGNTASLELSVDSGGKLHTKGTKQRIPGSVVLQSRKREDAYRRPKPLKQPASSRRAPLLARDRHGRTVVAQS